jgi:hypothetical protein
MSGNSNELCAPVKETKIIEFDNFVPEISFDSDTLVLRGIYADELSAHRAKKTWSRTLENNFLLDFDFDFDIRVTNDEDESLYRVNCDFKTACGRYAFWRITHDQVPDIQYIIRTAHIPSALLARSSRLYSKNYFGSRSKVSAFINNLISYFGVSRSDKLDR